MNFQAIILISLFGFLPSICFSQSKSSLPPFEISESCREFIKKLPSNFNYGWASSQTNPTIGDLSPIYIFYYYANDRDKSQIPIAYFNGGPAMDSHSSLNTVLKIEEVLPSPLKIVLMDQRGNGCSSPYPKRGPLQDLFYWGTYGIVNDAEEVRKALGFEKWHVFGQSFGANIAFRYLELFPERLLKVVAHGAAPLEQTIDALQLRLEQQVFFVKMLLEKYPQLRGQVRHIVRHRLCSAEVDPLTSRCGGNLIALLARRHFGSLDNIKTISESFERTIRAGNKQPLKRSMPSDDSISLVHVLNMADMGVESWADCSKVRGVFLRELKEPDLFSLSECWGYNTRISDIPSFQYFRDLLANMGLPYLSTYKIRKNLEAHPDVQAHLFSSQWDYYAPDATLARAASEMGPRLKYKMLLGEDHFAFAHNSTEEIFKIFATTE